MIDTGAVLDQVVSHFNVIVDDRFQQGRPHVFVLGVHFSTSLLEHNQISSLIAGTNLGDDMNSQDE